MNIALFGGRFDPVHNGHITVAREILKRKIADDVWLLPDFQHQWNPIVASIQDRLNMLKLATQSNQHIKVDHTAIDLGGSTEIFKVLQILQRKYSHRFIFIGGSDQLPSLNKWHYWKELEKILPFIIIIRKNYPTENKFNNVQIVEDNNYQPLEDSSTKIRKYLKEGRSIRGLVDPAVEKYIAEYKLYS